MRMKTNHGGTDSPADTAWKGDMRERALLFLSFFSSMAAVLLPLKVLAQSLGSQIL